MPPGGTSGGGQATASTLPAEEHVPSQLAMLVPTFEPGVDDVNIWSGKVELLLSTWPKTKIAELGTRLILGCRGSLFLKLQLYREEICVNDPKGIKKLVSLVGGSWGQIPLERKFELAEKALYKCIQKGDESSDSYLTRCDVVWTELLARQVKLEELQAYIMLRGSRLSPDDKKRVVVDSGAESGGSLEMSKVTAAVRMLGSSFFQEMSGVRREKAMKVYDHNAFLAEEPEDFVEQEAMMTMEDSFDEEAIEALAAEHDDDATMVLQFEDAIMDTIAADQELATFFSSYQDARRRLAEKGRVRGFWPVRKSLDKGKKGGKSKGKGRGGQSLASRIANSYCRICFKRGHWKDECPSNPNKSGQSSSSANPMVAPTSFAEVNELPAEIAHLPFVAQVSRESNEEQIFFGIVKVGDYSGVNYNRPDINMIKGKLCTGIKQCLRRRRHPSEAMDPSSVFRVTAPGEVRSNQKKTPVPNQVQSNPDHKQVPEDICFASTGTTGVVDLGASQTVIGNRQIPELLERLPLQVRNRVKRTNCNLVFRFGNHQTLTSRHALLLPIADTWFRIAIVEGNTPFLLSSDFLRKTLKAIIDTDKGTIWSKALNREIEVEITPKNLFLMDLVQIWEPKENALPVLASQVQVTIESQDSSNDVETKATGVVGISQSEVEINFNRTTPNENQHEKVSKTTTLSEVSLAGEGFPELQCQVGEQRRASDLLGPSSDTHRDSHSYTGSNHDISVSALQDLPEESQDAEGFKRTGDSATDDSTRTESREDCLWQVQTGDELRRGFQRWRMDGLVHRKLREVREGNAPEVHPLCRVTSGHGDSSRSCGRIEAATYTEDDCNKEQGISNQSSSTRSSPVSELVDSSGSRGVRGGDTPVCPDASRGRSGFHEGGEPPAESTPFGTRRSPSGSDCPSEAAHCQGGTVKAPSDRTDDLAELSKTDVDYEFLSTTESRNYHRECQRWIKKLTNELEQVMSESHLFPKRSSRLDMLEVMCSDDSEIAKQANHLGARAARFGLAQGDLQETGHRRKLFQILVHHRPESVWFSPECAPWCAWSRLNCSKSEELALKILNQRWANLWQLALAVVLFRFQQVHGRHFHLEQPFGSDMLSVPCVQNIVQELSWCCFDMCRLGNLRDPRSQEPIRKRLIVCTSSAALHRFLHGKFCVEDHIHRHVAGSIMTKQGSMPTSRFTEKYPSKFARQVVKVLLQEKPWEKHVFASQEDDHPTKRRRLGMKASPAEIAQMFPCINWQTALKLADSQAPRVGILVMETGELLNMVQKLCPDHDVRHLVLCRGTDRYVGPCKTMVPGEAPLRRRVCIRRRFEDIQVDEEWEAWERLTQKGLRRTGVAARVSLTIFATAKHRQEISTPTQDSASADAPIIHERPDMPESDAKRRCQGDDTTLDQPIIPHDGEVRQTVDLNSTKHGPLFQKLSREDQNWLLKLHRNLGHPGNAKLTQYCRQLGCPDAIVSAIEHLRCSTCQETAKPSIARPSAIHELEDFGDTVSMDGVTWTNQQGRQFHFYHFVCHGTAFQTAVCAPVRSSEMAIRAFMQGWVSWAGPPGMLCIDAATELNSEEFQVFAQKHNICVRTIATDAHWQNSRAERHGGILQEILKKMDTEEAIDSYERLEIALGFATSVKNQWSRHRGYPPEVLVFGKQRNIPASINSDIKIGAHSLAQSSCSEGTKFRKEIQVREMAQKAFVEVDNSQTMRRAILQRSRPPRENYQKGQWVMMWRRRGESQGSWIGPAQIIIQENSQVAWVSMGSKLYRIAPEHLRLLSAMEEQHLGKEHMNGPPLSEINQGVTQYQDLLSQGRGRNETEVPRNVQADEHPVGRNNTEEGNSPQPENSDRENDQPDHEPSVVSVPSSHENNSPRETVENTLTNPVEVPVPETDELFAEEAEAFVCQSDQVWKFEVDITDADIQNWKSESKPEEMAFIVSAAKKQRAEVRLAELNAEDRRLFETAKAKEIDSWISTETVAKILRHKVPQENIMRCRWILTWKPIDEGEQEKSASKTHPKHKPKARLVVLGFQDPEVDSIPRDSPTLTKLGRMLILQVAASSRWEIGSFDIKTAFLRGEEKSSRILGIEPPCELRDRMKLQGNEVLRLLKGAYGRVDAPFLWFMELKKALEELSFTQSPFDPCTFVLFNYETNKLDGVVGVHVDDGLCCGNERFQEKLNILEKKFPFGSRKRKDFVFTGLHIKQEPDFSIRVDQTQYVNDINPITLGKGRRNQSHDVVTEEERQGLRAVIGSLQYAAINTRPDLCHRLGLLQSSINKAKVENLLEANKLLHEAKQYSSVTLWIQPIPLNDVRFVTFSDASFASEKCPDSYQGTIVMAAHKDIAINKTTWVNPIMWQSRKIQKVAVSTLSAETMALAGSTDTLMWVRLFWAWLNDATLNWKDFDKTLLQLPKAFSALPESALEKQSCAVPQKVHQVLKPNDPKHPDTIATDCKSLFDLISRTAPPSCQEFRTLLQTKLIREHLQSGVQIRWVPSGAQVADSLTKAMDATMLREVLRLGVYSLHDETEILRARSDAKSRLKWLQEKASPTTTANVRMSN